MTEERRARTLSDADIEALIHGVLALQVAGMSHEEHLEHHRIYKTWLERENRRAERNEKIRAQVGGWLVISVLSAIGYAVWEGAKAVINLKTGGGFD